MTVDTELVDQPAPPASLRTRLEEVAELIEPRGGGVLITLDEVNTTSAADMRSLAADIQHTIREDREVGLVCSGLGAGIAESLSEKSLRFLRRASRVLLDLLSFVTDTDTVTDMAKRRSSFPPPPELPDED